MKVTGKIKNVVDFGAFVDLGIKETALLHISELSDSYVSDPMEVVRVGDIKECTIIGLDTDRRRISLSLKSSPVLHSAAQNAKGSPAGENAAAGARASGSSFSSGTKRAAVRVVRNANGHPAPRESSRRENSYSGRGNNDGMTYNPFAALLKK